MTTSERTLRARDTEARRLAKTEFERPLVLEAGAGTGKTATLVARIVTWATGPGWERARGVLLEAEREADDDAVSRRVLERVAAITFTEAAAAEMASRVGSALAEIAHGTWPPGLAAEDFPVAGDELAARALALREKLDRLEVRTIHAFCRRLIADAPLEAGVAPEFEIDADGSALERITREVLERELRKAWIEPVEPHLFWLATKGAGPRELEEAVLELIQKRARAEDFDPDPLAPERIAATVESLATRYAELVALDLTPLRKLPKNQRIHDVLEALGASAEELGRTDVRDLDSFEEFVRGLRAIWDGAPREATKRWKKKDITASELKKMGDKAARYEACASSFAVELAGVLELEPKLLDSARRVIARLLGAIEREFHTRGILSFDDLIRGARLLLENNEGIARRVRNGLDQLLVDEFQDTDADQCALLRKLALEGDTRPGLFLVGDPKQSIYAWRNADLAAYQSFVADVLAQGGAERPLAVNFRSVPAVLEEVERVISPRAVMEAVPGLQPAFEALLPAAHKRRDKGFVANGRKPVEHWLSWPHDDQKKRPAAPADRQRMASYEAEARALARDVSELHAAGALAWKDVAVLFRAATGIDTYLSAFREAGVPYEVQGDRHFYRRREIVDAIALVRCVLDPNDHVALVTFLRAPWTGVPDAALAMLWNEKLPRLVSKLREPDDAHLDELAAAIARAAEKIPGDVPGYEAVRDWPTGLNHALRCLARARASFEEDPVDVFVETLRNDFLLEANEAGRYLGAYRLANLQRFFRDLIRNIENQGDTQALLRALRTSVAWAREAEEGRPSDVAEDAVQILTIHGSKGLDFGHVYLPQLHRRQGALSERKTDFERLSVDGSADYRLLGARTPGYDAVRTQRERIEAAERARLLYVAMTRSKERLVLLSGWTLKNNGKAWDAASQFHELLEHRDGAREAVLSVEHAVSRGDLSPWTDPFGTLWRTTSEPPVEASLPFEPPEPDLPAPAELARVADRLDAERERARAHMLRPVLARASDASHAELAELETSDDERERATGTARAAADADALAAGHGGSREAALAAGTAVHFLLEEFDLGHDAQDEHARQAQRLPAVIDDLCHGPAREPALARAREIWERFARSPLFERFTGLGDDLVARELAVLLPPTENTAAPDDPLGFVSGAIDLLYRDPADGALVVADYKTDALEPEDVPARTLAYASQGATYARALAEALGLERPPRVEFWFLDPGIVEVVDESGTRR